MGSEKAVKEVLKVAKWEGRPIAPLVCRIDVGVLPDKSKAKGFRVFLNEIECEISTWLPRYCSFNATDVVAAAAVKKVVELVEGILSSGRSVPDAQARKSTVSMLKRKL